MKTLEVMENTYVGLVYNAFASLFGWAMIGKGLDSIPGKDLIQVIVTPAAESGIDVTSKILVIISTVLTCVATSITIGQFLYKMFKKKDK